MGLVALTFAIVGMLYYVGVHEIKRNYPDNKGMQIFGILALLFIPMIIVWLGL